MVDTLLLGLSRVRRALRPTALTLLLLPFLIVVPMLWLSGSSGRVGPGEDEIWRTHFGLGLVVVTMTGSSDEAATSTIEVEWGGLALALFAAFVVARATAAAVENATAGLLSPVRWTLVAVAVAVALGFLAATLWTRLYWGYWFYRPPVSASIAGLTRVSAASSIVCEAAEGRYRCSVFSDRSLADEIADCRRYAYECLGGRIAAALSEADVLPAHAPAIPLRNLHPVEDLLSSRPLLVPVEEGYRGNRRLAGVAAAGRTAEGQPALAVGLAGSQVSNDHYPYYEFLLSLGGEGATIERQRTIFYDVAGMEGFEWVAMFVYATLTALSLAIPACWVATVVGGLRRRNRFGRL